MITANTSWLGVLGWPISHSLSPAMHNAALAALGLDCVYLAFAVEPSQLTQAVSGARALGCRGLNVTIPHKLAALNLCQPDEVARDIGAVNTLVFEKGRIVGTNTDAVGFARLLDESKMMTTPGRVTILGAGGAARAVLCATVDKAKQVTVVSRKAEPIRFRGREIPSLPWTALSTVLPDTDLLVDATGQSLKSTSPIVDLAALPKDAQVVDLVVRKNTPLTDAARARSLQCCAGTAMLLHQGAAALSLWLGKPAPIQVMRDALDRALDA